MLRSPRQGRVNAEERHGANGGAYTKNRGFSQRKDSVPDPSSQKMLYAAPLNGWESVVESFPEATDHIEEASKCLALGRNTSIRRDLDALKWPEGPSRLGLDSVLVPEPYFTFW